MDDLAHLHSTLGKDPTSSATRAAGRGVGSTVVRNIVNRHLEEWTGYFAEKGVKVMLMTGAMLDGVLGYSLARYESGSSSSSKAELWERYNLGIRGKALSRDWLEISELIARTPKVVSPRWETASTEAGRRAGGTYYEQRMSAMGLDIQAFEIVEPVLAHTWLASLIRKAEGERTAPTKYNSRRPGLLAHSSSSSVGSSASMMSSGSVTSGGSDSLRSPSGSIWSASDQDSMGKNERSHTIAHGRKWKENRYSKERTKERMTRASCIWLVVLPLA